MVATPRTITSTDKDKANPSIQSQSLLSWRGANQAKVGDKITLSLNTQSTQGVQALGFKVGFDPTVLKAIDIIEGYALKRNNVPSKFTKSIDQAGGSIMVDMSGAGASGFANVVMMSFEVISSAPASPVTISSITAAGATGEPLSFIPPEPHVITVSQ